MFWNDRVKPIEPYRRLLIKCMGLHRGQGILEKDSVEYDCMDNSDVNETADKYIVWNHSTGRHFSK